MLGPLSVVDSAAAACTSPLARGAGSADRELAMCMQAGNVDAFGTAYERYAGRVYAFALRRLRDPTEAEDLCQDVFIEVARSIRGFQGRSALSTWILGIANHEVANRRRRSHREVASIDASEELSVPAPEAAVDDQVDAARVLARCLDVLDHEIGQANRQIFQLHLSGAGDMAAIAITVGKSRQAVKISVFRTRKHLGARVAGLRELIAGR